MGVRDYAGKCIYRINLAFVRQRVSYGTPPLEVVKQTESLYGLNQLKGCDLSIRKVLELEGS